jgi:hypothetical protein
MTIVRQGTRENSLTALNPLDRLPLTPEAALDAGWSQEATARATARMFARRGGVAHARRLLGVMQEELMQIEREGRRE